MGGLEGEWNTSLENLLGKNISICLDIDGEATESDEDTYFNRTFNLPCNHLNKNVKPKSKYSIFFTKYELTMSVFVPSRNIIQLFHVYVGAFLQE